MSLLGLDIGTTGCKAMLLGSGGAVLAVSYKEYPFVQERPGWVELDPDVVWGAVCEVVNGVATGARNDRIAALSISSHGESMTPVARDGTPLCRTIASLDKRTASMANFWEEFGRERLRQITGIPFHHRHSINRLVWLRRQMPEVYQAESLSMRWCLSCHRNPVPHLRPFDQVTTMGWDAAAVGYDPLADPLRVRLPQPPTSCSGCHR